MNYPVNDRDLQGRETLHVVYPVCDNQITIKSLN